MPLALSEHAPPTADNSRATATPQSAGTPRSPAARNRGVAPALGTWSDGLATVLARTVSARTINDAPGQYLVRADRCPRPLTTPPAPPTRPPTTSVAVLARMRTAEEFSDDLGDVSDDDLLRDIQSRLALWHVLNHQELSGKSESNDFDRLATLAQIYADTEEWLATDGRDRRRMEYMVPFSIEAQQELNALKRALREKRIQTRIAATGMKSALEPLAGAINAAVPTAGSKAEIEAEIDIAVDPHMVGFVGMRLKLEADRPDDSKVKARAELTFTAGAKFSTIGRIRLEFGGYLEAQGRNANEVMQLVSYALYRTMRESHVIPREFVNKLWGDEWYSDGYRIAEGWAGKVETGVLAASDAYVEVGALGGVMAEAGFLAGEVGAKAKAQVQVGGGERWDKKGMTAIHQEKSRWSDKYIDDLSALMHGGVNADPESLHKSLRAMEFYVSVARIEAMQKKLRKLNPIDPQYSNKVREIVRAASPTTYRPALGQASSEEVLFGAQEGRGERTMWLKGSGEANISVAMASLKSEIALQTRGRDRMVATHLREVKFEAKAGVTLALSKALGPGLLVALGVEKLVSASLDFIRTKATVVDNDKLPEKEKTARAVGSGARILGGLGQALTQLPEFAGKEMQWGHGGQIPGTLTPGFTTNTTLAVSLEAKWKPEQPDGSPESTEINFQVAEEKGWKYEGDVGVVGGRVGGKTQERWLRIQYKDGNWTADLAGHLKQLAKQ